MTELGVAWPQGFANLFREAVSSDILEQLAGEAPALADCPNFWLPMVSVISVHHLLMLLDC